MDFNRAVEIEKRESLACELETRFATIIESLNIIENEINHLNISRELLESDMVILKHADTVPSISELRRNKGESRRIINRLTFLLSDRIGVETALRVTKKLIDINRQELEELHQGADNVIVSGRFREDKDG